MCTPVTAIVKQQSLVTSQRLPGTAGSQPSGQEEHCTEATPTSLQLGSTGDAHTMQVVHFHSEEKHNTHTTILLDKDHLSYLYITGSLFKDMIRNLKS